MCFLMNQDFLALEVKEEGLISFPERRGGRLVTEEQDVRQAKVTGNQHVKPFSL